MSVTELAVRRPEQYEDRTKVLVRANLSRRQPVEIAGVLNGRGDVPWPGWDGFGRTLKEKEL